MLTGLIFGIIVILWVIYLVPLATFRDKDAWDRVDPATLATVGESMHVVRDCSAEIELSDSGAEISTPLQRRAARFQVRRANQIAQRRRRIAFLVNSIVLLATIIVPFFAPISHWLTFGGVLLFIAGLALSAYSVQTMRRASNRRLAEIAAASDEETQIIDVEEQTLDSTERSIDLTDELENIESLLAPIPVTPSTYISKPLLPRSVRTIDLAAPLPPQRPVTADRPGQPAVEDHDLPKAVGE